MPCCSAYGSAPKKSEESSTIANTWSCCTSFCTAVSAPVGVEVVSARMYLILWPFTPPAALIRFRYASIASLLVRNPDEATPVRSVTKPIVIVFDPLVPPVVPALGPELDPPDEPHAVRAALAARSRTAHPEIRLRIGKPLTTGQLQPHNAALRWLELAPQVVRNLTVIDTAITMGWTTPLAYRFRRQQNDIGDDPAATATVSLSVKGLPMPENPMPENAERGRNTSDSVARILPELTIANEFYWTSGSDDCLRFAQCTRCQALVHPPAPMCRHCRGTDLTVTEVSGLARLIGFTVNHRMRIPGLEPPYVIGQVAIEEDDRVRLTTRIVDADPDELMLGQQVRVVFEHVDDVYLPLFTPTGQAGLTALPEDEIAPAQMRQHVRMPRTGHRFEHDSAITGIGASQIGRRLMRDPLSLTIEASLAAIEDAGLRVDDIDGLSTYPGGPTAAGMGEGGVTALESSLRINPTWYNGGGGAFGPARSVIAPLRAVSARGR